MEDIEILEEMSIALKEHNLNPIVINFDKYNEAISNILKERQADKEKIKELYEIIINNKPHIAQQKLKLYIEELLKDEGE